MGNLCLHPYLLDLRFHLCSSYGKQKEIINDVKINTGYNAYKRLPWKGI
jgi:hypothetical protein